MTLYSIGDGVLAADAVKVVFASGYTDDAIVHYGVMGEGTHFQSKPYTSVELTRKVREVLDA